MVPTPQQLEIRLKNLLDTCTYVVFNYTRRGLFDRDKLIVLTLLTFQILLTVSIHAHRLLPLHGWPFLLRAAGLIASLLTVLAQSRLSGLLKVDHQLENCCLMQLVVQNVAHVRIGSSALFCMLALSRRKLLQVLAVI